MPEIHELILYLNNNGHIGRENSITATELAVFFGISDRGVEVEMRDVIRNAINRGNLIGSCNRGFYIIRNLTEIEENLNSLQSRAESILNRRQSMRNGWNNLPNQQNPTTLPDLRIESI